MFLSQRRLSLPSLPSLLPLKSVFPFIANVAETRFSTTAAMVATGAIIWRPGLNDNSVWKCQDYFAVYSCILFFYLMSLFKHPSILGKKENIVWNRRSDKPFLQQKCSKMALLKNRSCLNRNCLYSYDKIFLFVSYSIAVVTILTIRQRLHVDIFTRIKISAFTLKRSSFTYRFPPFLCKLLIDLNTLRIAKEHAHNRLDEIAVITSIPKR